MNRRNEKAITLIALVVTIVVLLILAGVSISMLTGENGIIKQAQDAKENSSQAKVEEAVKLAITSLIVENKGDKSSITPGMIAEQVNKDENRTDVTAEGNTFPTKIIFTEENREVDVDGNLNLDSGSDSDTEETGSNVFSDPSLEAEANKNVDLFEYEIIDTAEVSATTLDSLPTKEARITGIKQIYCNDVDGGVTNPETGEKVDTNYEIIYKGEKITDTLVIPYQVEIDGEMYKITEVSLKAYGKVAIYPGYALPLVKTVIFPNTIRFMESTGAPASSSYLDYALENVIFSENLEEIGSYAFHKCETLKCITIPTSLSTISYMAFSGCDNLTTVNYRGTKEQWEQISIEDGNDALTNATINYNYTGE